MSSRTKGLIVGAMIGVIIGQGIFWGLVYFGVIQ